MASDDDDGLFDVPAAVAARMNRDEVRVRIAEARWLIEATKGKTILDVPGEMIDLRRLCRQLADDAEMLLDAREAEREG